MNETIKEIIIMLILPAFETLIGLFEDEIKGVISQNSTMILFVFIWVSIIGELIYLALKNVQRKNEVKKLKDEVKKYKRGRFLLLVIKANPAKVVELNRQFKLNPDLLKCMFVKIDE